MNLEDGYLNDSLQLAEETARIMWSNYQTHLAIGKREADWEQKNAEILAQCKACDERVEELRLLKEKERPRHPSGAPLAQGNR